MRLALRLARRALGRTSPNPLVGAVVVQQGRIIGKGWHHCAGEPHAEIEAMRDAVSRGHSLKGGTLYVTLEPCCTQGRTPPCTDTIIACGIRRVVVGAIDPNPAHQGRGLHFLRSAGIEVATGVLEEDAAHLNEAFNHWIVRRQPFVTVKAAMTLDGKIATPGGESKWITGPKARAWGMRLRQSSDAILVGVNTIVADNPALTRRAGNQDRPGLRRVILDARARTPLGAKVVSDQFCGLTTVVVTGAAPAGKTAALARRVRIMKAPGKEETVDLRWLLRALGRESVTSLLVEGGGEVNASFLLQGLAHRVAFFYAPKLLGARNAIKGVGGQGITLMRERILLSDIHWRRLGPDWLMTALVECRRGR